MMLEVCLPMDELLSAPGVSSHPPRPVSLRRIAVLGSSGSIGTQTLDVVANLGPHYQIQALAAATSWKTLAQQARTWRPKVIALSDGRKHAADLAAALHDLPINILHGPDALVEIARREDVDTVVAAVVGAAGLRPVIAAVEAGKTVALANKEALVVAGSIVMPAARRHGATVLPVDSEHSAIFQSLRSGTTGEIRKIILTASGGPFRTWSAAKIHNATIDEALAHPNWKMGDKISIDSATLMNKGFEVIEAHHLFGLDYSKIGVVVHPQSVIHAMIELVDGSVIAQMAAPDMRIPIQYALLDGERVSNKFGMINLPQAGPMTFEEPDMDKFP